MGWVEPIVFSDLCKWLDSMAMHQADVIIQTGGTIGDSLCAPCPWFFDMDTWGSFPLSFGAKLQRASHGHSAHLLNNFACDTERTNRLRKSTTISVYVEGGVCFTNISHGACQISAPWKPSIYKMSVEYSKLQNLFRTDLNSLLATLAIETSENWAKLVDTSMALLQPVAAVVSSTKTSAVESTAPASLADENR
jgi:hypothetical protein